MKKDGYFLPKNIYHQAEITLRGTAELNKVIMSPAVKTQDIQPGNYQNMYIKSSIPNGATVADHETRLKTWWSEEE